MNQNLVTKFMSLVILSLLVLMLPSGASADEEEYKEEWPFVAIINGNVVLQPTDDPCIFRNEDMEASGFATYMGDVSATTEEYINVCSNQPDLLVNGTFVLKNAKQDEITCTYETIATPIPESFEISSVGSYECQEGKGQFEFCSGEGVIGALGSLISPEESLALVGELNWTVFER